MIKVLNSLIIKRLAKSTEGSTPDKLLTKYASMRERAYASLLLFILTTFSITEYILKFGWEKYPLYIVVGIILLVLLSSVVYHSLVFLNLRDYLEFMFKPIQTDSERPENFYKRLISKEVVSSTESDSEVLDGNSEGSEGVVEEK